MADPRIAEAFVEIRPDTRGFRTATQRQVKTSLAGGLAGLTGRQAGVAGLAAGLAILSKRAVQAGIDFEDSFAGVRKTVDATEAVFAGLETDLRGLARQIPVNVNQLNAIAAEAGALGIQADSITSFTDTIAKLSVTTNLLGEQGADALARIANITELPQQQISRLGATLVDLGNKLAATESEIVDFGLRIAGAGNQVGLTEGEILGIGGALASVGINAESGGTAISTTLVKIASAVEKGDKKLALFAQTAGLTAQEFTEKWKDDPAQALVAFIEGLGRLGDAGGSVFTRLEELGLGSIRVRDAMLRSAGAGDLLARAIEIGNTAFEENTALQEEAAKRFATTRSQITLFRNNLNDLSISFSQRLMPSINGAIGGLNTLVERLRASNEAPAIGATFSASFEAVGRVIKLLQPEFEILIDVMRRNIGSWAELVRAARPFLIVIGVTLVVAIKAAIRVIDLLSRAMALMAKTAAKVLDGITFLIDKFLGALSTLADAASNLPFVGGHFKGISDKINEAREQLRGLNAELDATNGKTVFVTIDQRVRGALGLPATGATGPGGPGGLLDARPRGTTGAAPRGVSNVPSALRTELTAATAAREQRLLDEAELARLSTQTISDDNRAIGALIAFYSELAKGDRFTVAARRSFAVEEARMRGELAQINQQAADESKQAAEDAQAEREKQAEQARSDRLEILGLNRELARLTQGTLGDDRRALRDIAAFWHAQAAVKSATVVERRRALLEEKRALTDLKALNREAVQTRINEREALLQDNLTLARLTDRTTKDDDKALRALIAFWRKRVRNTKEGTAARRKAQIELQRARNEQRDARGGGDGPGAAQRAFDFLGTMQGVFQSGSNFFAPGVMSVGREAPSPAAAKLPRLGGGRDRAALAGEAAERLRQQVSGGMTQAQASELITLQRQTVRLLSDLHRGAGHPENRYATHAARASMDIRGD